MELLSGSCKISNVGIINSVLNLMKGTNKKYDITESFIFAARNGLTEICKSLISDDCFKIDISSFLENKNSLGRLKKDLFVFILDRSTPELRELFLSISLDPAIINKNKELIEYLVEQKVSSNNALINAIRTNDLEIVDIILKYNSTPSFVNSKSRDGTPLCIATNMNNLEIVKRLLAIPGIDPNLYYDDDRTPLISSIVNFNLDIMNAIIDFYGEKIQEQMWQLDKAIRMTLSMFSAQNEPDSTQSEGRKEQVKKTDALRLVSKQSPRQQKPKNQMTEHEKQLLPILNRILQIKNIDPNLHSGEHTLLSYACEANEVSIVQMLLETDKIDVNAYAPNSGNTPLMISIINDNLDITKLLIRDKRTNINARNFDGETALTLAVERKMEVIVSELIKNEKFDPVESSLNYAFYISSSPISNLLITVPSLDVNYKVYNNIKKMNDQNQSSRLKLGRTLKSQDVFSTPLSKAIGQNDSEKVKLILRHPSYDKVKSQIIQSIFKSADYNNDKLFKILMETIDNDVNIMNYSKKTLLNAALYSSSGRIVDEILNNEKFDTTKNNILESFKYFLSHCDFSDDIANSILEFDAKNTHLIDLHDPSYFFILFDTNCIDEKIEFLLDHGADPNVPNENGVYPLANAIYIENKKYVLSLLKSDKVDLTKHITAESKNDEFVSNGVKDFLKKHNFTAKYTTYLHLAAKSGKIISKFLKLDSININELDEQGNTPLMYAVANKNHKAIEKLFDFSGQDLDYLHVNNDGISALTIIGYSNEDTKNIKDKTQFRKFILDNLYRNGRNDPKLTKSAPLFKSRDENNSESENTDNKPKEETPNAAQQEEKNSGSDEKLVSMVPKKQALSFKLFKSKNPESGEKSLSSGIKKLEFESKRIGIKTNQQHQEAKDSESGEKSPSSGLKKLELRLKSSQQHQEAKDSESGEKSPSSGLKKLEFESKRIGIKTNQQHQEAKDSESGEKSQSSGLKKLELRLKSSQQQQEEKGSESTFSTKNSCGNKEKINFSSFTKLKSAPRDASESASSNESFVSKESDQSDESGAKNSNAAEKVSQVHQLKKTFGIRASNEDAEKGRKDKEEEQKASFKSSTKKHQDEDDSLLSLGSQGREISRRLNSGLEQEIESAIGDILGNASPDVVKAISENVYEITSRRLKRAAMSLPANKNKEEKDDENVLDALDVSRYLPSIRQPVDYQTQMMQQQLQQLMQMNYNSQFQFNMQMQQMQAMQMVDAKHQSKKKKKSKGKK